MNKAFRWLCIAVLMAGLSACGAGGGDPGTSPFNSNAATGSQSGTDSGGSGSTPSPIAADLFISLSKASVTNTGSDTVTVTATAVDANRNAIPGISVVLSANSGAVVIPAGNVTDNSGRLTATVGIGADKSNRAITVTAIAGTLTRTAAFLVTGGRLVGTPLPAVMNTNSTGNKIQFVLSDANLVPIGGQTVTITSTGLPSVNGTTGTDGAFDYNFTAPATPGKYTVFAAAAGLTPVPVEITVQGPGGSVVIDDVTQAILSASVTADPSVVSANTGSTNNFGEVRARFLGANNTPIPNVRVRFDLDGDSNSIGGTFASGTSTVYSDQNGIATTRYTPGSRSSPTNGVTVRACYGPTDASIANNACPNSARATLTVVAEPISVSIGTDNTISNGAGGLTYIKRFVVMVVNASGQAMPDVEVTPSVDLIRYYKGAWGTGASTCSDGSGAIQGLCQSLSAATQSPADDDDGSDRGCLNEDANRNGSLETTGGLGPGGTEDFNGNGALDPRKANVSIRAVGTNRTDASGIVIIQLEYPENMATWVKYRILASASGVSGTEGRDQYFGVLPALQSDFGNPAFGVSPYGTANSCNDPT